MLRLVATRRQSSSGRRACASQFAAPHTGTRRTRAATMIIGSARMAARRMAAARVSPFAGARAELAATGVRRLSTAPAVRISPTRVALGLGAAAGVVGLGALGGEPTLRPQARAA